MPWTTLPDGTLKIDVRPYILGMRDILDRGTDAKTRDEILTALQRWTHDTMLNDESRAMAHEITVAFGHPELSSPPRRSETGSTR